MAIRTKWEAAEEISKKLSMAKDQQVSAMYRYVKSGSVKDRMSARLAEGKVNGLQQALDILSETIEK